jgi:hypothetical protein
VSINFDPFATSLHLRWALVGLIKKRGMALTIRQVFVKWEKKCCPFDQLDPFDQFDKLSFALSTALTRALHDSI